MNSHRYLPEIRRKKSTLGLTVGAIAALSTMAIAPAQADGESTLDFYGAVQFDAIYDFNRMDPAWKDSLRPSKIPISCPGDAGCGTDGETIFSVRQSRFGVTAITPTDLGALKTNLEFELYGVGNDEGKTTPRLRHAYGEIGSFLVGQTNSVFMDGDTFPNTIEYWGPASMVFWRNIQMRWTPIQNESTRVAIALESPSSSIDSGKLDGIDPSLNLNGKTELPDLTAHWHTNGNWGHAQVAGILRQVSYENTATANNKPSGSEVGYGVNLTGSLSVGTHGTFRGQLAYGNAIASYFNDGGIDMAPSGNGSGPETLDILGWFLFYDHNWSSKWSSSVGWAETDQDNSNGQTGTAFTSNQYGVVNLLHYPTTSIMLGAELQYGQYAQNNGVSADDSRIQFTTKFSF